MKKRKWAHESIPRGRDPASGTVITQLTSEPVTSHNIYCEQNFCSSDGRRVAIARTPFGRPTEVWVCDLDSFRLTRIGEGVPARWNAQSNSIYLMSSENSETVMKRLDMGDLSQSEIRRFHDDAPLKVAVSPDEKWFVGGPFHVKNNVFSLRLYGIDTDEWKTLCEIEDMINPHHQFDPAGTGRLLVQVNRGGQCDPEIGTVTRLSGPDGSTLVVVEVPSGDIAPLPVGLPATPRLSGHQCWAGHAGTVLFTTAPGAHKTDPDNAGVHAIIPGENDTRRVAGGLPFNHLAASNDGRFFIVDDHAERKIHVGNVETEEYRELCDSHTLPGKPQHVHAHPTMTPDDRFVIFNSVTTGVAQVYAARIPDGFLMEFSP